jgi:hypothetical protein
MESVFHKYQWDRDAKRSIALAEVQRRLVRVVGVLDDLRLADLTAAGVMAAYFGLTLGQLASRGYAHTQRVSDQVHAMRGSDDVPIFDGVLYPSRNNYPAASVKSRLPLPVGAHPQIKSGAGSVGDLMGNRPPPRADVMRSRFDPIERVVTVAHRAPYPGELNCAV